MPDRPSATPSGRAHPDLIRHLAESVPNSPIPPCGFHYRAGKLPTYHNDEPSALPRTERGRGHLLASLRTASGAPPNRGPTDVAVVTTRRWCGTDHEPTGEAVFVGLGWRLCLAHRA